MPPSYGIDRTATGGMIPWGAVADRLASARNYWIGTTCPDGRPHAAPVWAVWLDDALSFATDLSSRKGRNLAARPEVVVHLESGDDVVILEGAVEAVREPSELARFADAYEAKYAFRPHVDVPAPGVFRLRPRVAYAWLERDFPATATRWRFPGPRR
ncbi:MAG: pyridoxamine 5'-phosphate oxidase family protein [Chloroflexi bacterium]|nr:pyridoxamine 5'-phosphate oxidase family protein [Chloroflexota bacterium]